MGGTGKSPGDEVEKKDFFLFNIILSLHFETLRIKKTSKLKKMI